MRMVAVGPAFPVWLRGCFTHKAAFCPVLTAAMLLLLAGGRPEAMALEDGRIGVLYAGCLARSTPIWWMRSDPLFSINFVQATLRDWAALAPIQAAKGEGEIYRIIRLYMPRSLSDLTSRFDVIILSNANREAVPPTDVEMLARGVRDAAMGLVMVGGWESFGGAFARPAWGDSAVGQLLPTEDAGNIYIHRPADVHTLVIDKPDHEFMSSLPWDRTQPFMYNYHHNLVTAKPGALVLAHVEGPGYKDDPGFVTWDLSGGGRTFSITGEIFGPSSEPGQLHTMCTTGNPWDYALDFGANLMIYLDRRPVPQDVELVHRVRKSMFDLGTRKSLLVGLLEFCDSFGANTNEINSRLDEVNQMTLDVLPAYFELRFEDVIGAYDQAHEALDDIEKDAIVLKDRALLWVYVIEWLAVTGTAMAAGFLLWSVMIRRMLWREVRTTKLTTQTT